MALRKVDGPLTVQLPSAAADRPAWLGVGAIAIVGFVLGVAWPRLVGVRPGPSVPEGTTVASAVGSAAKGSTVAGAASTSGAGVAGAAQPAALLSAPAASPAAPGATGATKVSVGHGVVFACKTTSGDTRKGGECGSVPPLDGLIVPRLRKLADCPDAAGSSGALHLNVRADFARGVVSAALAREKSLSTGEALLACAKPLLASVSLDGVAHENARYSVAYTIAFTGGGSGASSAAANGANGATTAGGANGASALAVSPAAQPAPAAETVAPQAPPAGDGTAQIEWEVALVRDTPKTGKVVARLQRGTSVRVGPGKDGWYPVKFGDNFAEDGWLYRGAIGR